MAKRIGGKSRTAVVSRLLLSLCSPAAGLASPDGRYIAVVGTAENKNMWMMENF
jgi:hypothetical protein